MHWSQIFYQLDFNDEIHCACIWGDIKREYANLSFWLVNWKYMHPAHISWIYKRLLNSCLQFWRWNPVADENLQIADWRTTKFTVGKPWQYKTASSICPLNIPGFGCHPINNQRVSALNVRVDCDTRIGISNVSSGQDFSWSGNAKWYFVA